MILPCCGESKKDSLDTRTVMIAEKAAMETSDAATIRRVRLNLARLNPGSIRRLRTSAGFYAKLEDIRRVIRNCSLLSQNAHSRRPLIKEYVPLFAGHAVCSDVFYPLDDRPKLKSRRW